ncbi:hypothetical protein VNO77_49339 [Canavalia gladiata]|uniref:Uncharacterized protein n=1 Tax=Canavalia gladiata TaxID=3824 RepID=A0AAN9JFR1_CANGL
MLNLHDMKEQPGQSILNLYYVLYCLTRPPRKNTPKGSQTQSQPQTHSKAAATNEDSSSSEPSFDCPNPLVKLGQASSLILDWPLLEYRSERLEDESYLIQHRTCCCIDSHLLKLYLIGFPVEVNKDRFLLANRMEIPSHFRFDCLDRASNIFAVS